MNINVCQSSCKVPDILVRFYWKLILTTNFLKILKHQIS
jgi:hypothetical protein